CLIGEVLQLKTCQAHSGDFSLKFQLSTGMSWPMGCSWFQASGSPWTWKPGPSMVLLASVGEVCTTLIKTPCSGNVRLAALMFFSLLAPLMTSVRLLS